MAQRKKLKELVFKDNFIFGAVMTEEENSRLFLEMVLGFSIEKVVVSKERSMVYHPEYKGVRLDIFAKDQKNNHYNVEMQVAKKPDLGKRVRYYRGQMDVEMLLTGVGYEELPNTYIIFICDFDPFGEKKYCYTFENRCLEKNFALKDGSRAIFLNTHGENPEEVSERLVRFLNFVGAGLEESTADFEDPLVARIQESIRHIKRDRGMEARYMLFEELLRDERNEGRAEGRLEGRLEIIFELLEDIGPIPEDWKEKISRETDPEVLKKYVKLARRAESVEDFIQAVQNQ